MIISNIQSKLSFKKNKIIWKKDELNFQKHREIKLDAKLLLKSDLVSLSDNFDEIKYIHLWEPLKLLCIVIESILIRLNSIHQFGWGISIILLSLCFKIFILPLSIFIIFAQRKVSHIQASLSSELEYIKLRYSGEEAHNKFLEAHKAKGVTPYYNLKPLLVALFPIPFFIAIFNVLGEIDLISGHSFLWIKDLAYPDSIFYIAIEIPLLGNSINLLPILMTILTIYSSFFFKNKIVSAKELQKQKLNLYLMSFGFFFLFYPFPSAMVLYWTFNNIGK